MDAPLKISDGDKVRPVLKSVGCKYAKRGKAGPGEGVGLKTVSTGEKTILAMHIIVFHNTLPERGSTSGP